MCVNVHWPYRFFNDFHNEHQEQLLCYSHLIRFPEFYKWVCSLSVVASCLRGNQETQGRNSKHFLFSSDLNTISFFLDHRAGKLTNQYLFPFCIPYQGFFRWNIQKLHIIVLCSCVHANLIDLSKQRNRLLFCRHYLTVDDLLKGAQEI